MGIVACPFFKSREVKEWLIFIKSMDQKSRCHAAQKTGHQSDCQNSGTQRRTVNDQLWVEQDRRHHESSQPVFPHSLFGKGCRNRNGSVHTQRRGNPEQTCRDDTEQTPFFIPHPSEQSMNFIFGKNRNERPDEDADHPVPKDLVELELKVIAQVNKFTVHNFQHKLIIL